MFSSCALSTRLKDFFGFVLAAGVLLGSALMLLASLLLFTAFLLACAVAEKVRPRPALLPLLPHERIEPR